MNYYGDPRIAGPLQEHKDYQKDLTSKREGVVAALPWLEQGYTGLKNRATQDLGFDIAKFYSGKMDATQIPSWKLDYKTKGATELDPALFETWFDDAGNITQAGKEYAQVMNPGSAMKKQGIPGTHMFKSDTGKWDVFGTLKGKSVKAPDILTQTMTDPEMKALTSGGYEKGGNIFDMMKQTLFPDPLVTKAQALGKAGAENLTQAELAKITGATTTGATAGAGATAAGTGTAGGGGLIEGTKALLGGVNPLTWLLLAGLGIGTAMGKKNKVRIPK